MITITHISYDSFPLTRDTSLTKNPMDARHHKSWSQKLEKNRIVSMPNRSQVPYYCSCHNISCLFANHHRSVNQTRSHLDSNEIQKQLVHSSRKSSHRLLAFREAVTTESHTYIPNLISHQMLLSLHSVCFCFHNFFLRRLTWLTFLLHRSLDTEIMKIHVILATLALFLLGCIAESDGVMVKVSIIYYSFVTQSKL